MANISLRLSRLSFTALAGFAQSIHDGFVAQAVIFVTPNPLMLVFQTHIDDLVAASAKWGTKPIHGSSSDKAALVDAATIVKLDLKMLAQYAMNTVPTDPSKWIDIGFALKNPRGKPLKLQVVQNFRHFIARDLAAPKIKIKWKRPLFTQSSDVKMYAVQRSNTPEYPLPPDGHAIINIIGFTTATEFIDSDPFVGANYYWVTPMNAAGLGVTSEAVLVVSTKTNPA
jgi:hypothetical protein